MKRNREVWVHTSASVRDVPINVQAFNARLELACAATASASGIQGPQLVIHRVWVGVMLLKRRERERGREREKEKQRKGQRERN